MRVKLSIPATCAKQFRRLQHPSLIFETTENDCLPANQPDAYAPTSAIVRLYARRMG